MNRDPLDRTARFAVSQSIAEIFIGSILHALHVPFAGHTLSLNQALILTLAARGSRTRREAVSVTTGISGIASAMKSLSPAGKKLMPMVAIAMQGWFYALGIGVVGANLLGAILGAMLLSIWAFVQPLLAAYVFFGSSFFGGVKKLWLDAADILGIDPALGVWILVGIVCVKLLLAIGIAFVAWRADEAFEQRYLAHLEALRTRVAKRSAVGKSEVRTPAAAARGAVGDLMSPLFIVSLGISVGFFALSRNQNAVVILLYAARVLAVGFLAFWAIRAFPMGWVRAYLARNPRLEATARHLRSGLTSTPEGPYLKKDAREDTGEDA